MEKGMFEREISICRKRSKKNGGKCNWGECLKCGVIPLLYKIETGRIYESAEEIVKLKSDVLGKNDNLKSI